MSEVVEINSLDELRTLHLTWTSLWNETRGRGFCQTLPWLECYWRHFGDGQTMRVLLVNSGGRPIGILPLVVTRESTRLGRVPTLTYPLHDWGSFYGPLGPNPTATLLAGLRHIQRTPRDWELLDLRWIRATVDRGRTQTALDHLALPSRRSVWKDVAMVDMTEGWDGYWAGRTSKFRNNVRRAMKRTAARGTVELDRYRPRGTADGEGDARWDLYDECVELSRQSWQGSSFTGTTLCHAEVGEFFRDAHQVAAHLGLLDLNVLRVDGRAVAFGYNYVADGEVQGVRAGYHPDFANCNAGTVLYHRMIEDSFARKDRRLDLGPGSLECKRSWITRIEPSYRHTHYPLTVPRSQLLRLKHWYCEMRNAECGSRV